jgi:Flp pilus assembly protein TadB
VEELNPKQQHEAREYGSLLVVGLIFLIAFGLAWRWPMPILTVIFAVMSGVAFTLWFVATGRSRRRAT